MKLRLYLILSGIVLILNFVSMFYWFFREPQTVTKFYEVTKYFPVDTQAILKSQLRNLLAFRETRFAKNAYRINDGVHFGRYQFHRQTIEGFGTPPQAFINSPTLQDSILAKSFDYYLTQYRPPSDWLLAYWYACHTSGYVYAGKEFRLNAPPYFKTR